MKQEDIQLLKEVQRNTEKAMKAVRTIAEKVYDDDLALHLGRQSLKYSEIHDRAVERLLSEREEPDHGNALEEFFQLGEIHGSTLFNTSTSRLAELLMQESSRGIARMCRAVHQHESAAAYSVELAEEFMNFEESNREQLKKYL